MGRAELWRRGWWPSGAATAAVSRGGCDAEAERRRPTQRAWRGWLLVGLLLFPLGVYAPAVFHRYGFRDDYAVLREAREESGKVFQFCAAQARPLLGWLQEHSFRLADGIDDLRWLRLTGTLLLGVVTATLFVLLRRAGWAAVEAMLVAALIVVLPSAQLIASWAVAWPLAGAVLLALAAFAWAERGLGRREGRAWALGGAVVLMAASALTYQPSAQFYCVAMVAVAVTRAGRPQETWRWLAGHGVVAGTGLALAFGLMLAVFAAGWLPESKRVAVEADIPGKLAWLAGRPLQNALATIVLNRQGGAPAVGWTALLTGAAIAAGLARRGWRAGWSGVAVAGLAAAGTVVVNLAVADRWPAYRVIFALAAGGVVLLAAALSELGGRRAARGVLAVMLLVGAGLAARQSFGLVAWPQGLELNLLEAGAARIDPALRPSVFVLTPHADEHAAVSRYGDEFGSLTTDSYWAPKEILKHIMRARYPGMPDVNERYRFECGHQLPPGRTYDVVIDLHRVRGYRPAAARER